MLQKIPRSLLISCTSLFFVLFCALGSVANSKTLTIATEPVFAPFEYQVDGELRGFDIDLIRAVGQAAGFQVKFQSISFDGIIPALKAGTVDAAIAAMTITPERAQSVAFSRPYFKAGLAIAIRNSNQEITNLETLQGKIIAVQIGTTGAKTAQAIPRAKVRTFDAAVLALQELRNGNVDAVINDAPATLYAIKAGNLQGIKVVGQLLTEEYYGIPTALNSPHLDPINQGLTTILDNQTYAQIYRKWFATDPPTLPATIGQNSPQSTQRLGIIQVIWKAFPSLIKGALITLELTALAVFFGLIGGSFLGIVRLSSLAPLRWFARAYIDFLRGTPLLVQIFMIYFGFPALIQQLGIQFSFDRLIAAIVALSLNSAAYIGEIVRAGIQSIDIGQSEAARSLGLNAAQTMQYVIFPQAFRRMIPPLGNEFISLLKDTSLVAVIGFEELFRQGQLIVAENYRPFELYAAVALIYLVLTVISSRLFSALERWMNPLKPATSQEPSARNGMAPILDQDSRP
jgi:arginine/lysine/histidine/glutamine transport system substrate-binding/permease protein